MSHGKTVGSCGHVIAQCRCIEGHANVTTVSQACGACVVEKLAPRLPATVRISGPHRAVDDIAAEADRGARLFPKAIDYPDGTRNGGANLVQREQAKNSCDRAAREDRCTFAHVLAEEFWEAMCEEDRDRLRAELVQVAAVALQWIENIDRAPAAAPIHGREG